MATDQLYWYCNDRLIKNNPLGVVRVKFLCRYLTFIVIVNMFSF